MYKINNIQNLKKYNIVFILFITLFPSNLINTLNGLPLTSLFENVFLGFILDLFYLPKTSQKRSRRWWPSSVLYPAYSRDGCGGPKSLQDLLQKTRFFSF